MTPVLDLQAIENIYSNIRVLKWVMIPAFSTAILNFVCYALKDEEIQKALIILLQKIWFSICGNKHAEHDLFVIQFRRASNISSN